MNQRPTALLATLCACLLASAPGVTALIAADGPTPAAEQPTPAAEQPTPAAEQPTPAAEQPTPAAEQPTPAAEQPTPAAEQPTPAASEAAKQMLRDAFAKSQQATTIEDYDRVMALCQQAEQQGGLSEDLVKYSQRLRAWSHNRRGEAQAEQAAALSKAGKTQEAAQLDAQATAEFEAAIALNPDYWKAIHNRGVSRGLAGKFEEAVQDFTRTVELTPGYANAWFNRGEIYYELGKYEEAAADYSSTLKLRPADHDALLRRGHAYFQLRRFQEALADYQQAVQQAPEDAVVLVNRGDAYRSLRQWPEAAADFQKAIRLNGELGRAYQSAAWLMATCPDSRFRNPQLAVQAAQKAIELDGKDDFKYLDTLAAALASAGEFEQARQAQTEAIEKAPQNQQETLKQRWGQYQQNLPFREQ